MAKLIRIDEFGAYCIDYMFFENCGWEGNIFRTKHEYIIASDAILEGK